MSKAKVLFVHGAGGGGWEWNIWQRVFQAHGFTTYAPDLLRSSAGLAETLLDDYWQQVRKYFHALESPKVLIGASLGGLLGLMNSDQADALILLNPMPPAPFHKLRPAIEKYPPIIPWRIKASLHGTRRALLDSDEMTCLFAFRHWRDESGAVMNQAKQGVDVTLPLCPVMIMASEQDEDVPFETSKNLAEKLNASFIILRKTSHVGPLLGKNASQFALQAVAFLNGIF